MDKKMLKISELETKIILYKKEINNTKWNKFKVRRKLRGKIKTCRKKIHNLLWY